MSVVEFISSWLKDIVVLFILISIAGLVMPKGNMKKYIDLVIGLLIIFTIISPFAKLIKMDFSLEETVFNYSKYGNFASKEEDYYSLEQDKQIETVYKSKIKTEIATLIETESKYKVIELSVELSDDKERYGDIKHLEILIGERESVEEARESKVFIEKVKPVEINKKIKPIEINKEIDKTSGTDENKYKELKDLIFLRYSIERDKITIREYEKEKGE